VSPGWRFFLITRKWMNLWSWWGRAGTTPQNFRLSETPTSDMPPPPAILVKVRPWCYPQYVRNTGSWTFCWRQTRSASRVPSFVLFLYDAVSSSDYNRSLASERHSIRISNREVDTPDCGLQSLPTYSGMLSQIRAPFHTFCKSLFVNVPSSDVVSLSCWERH
jgi:hypothetical protein